MKKKHLKILLGFVFCLVILAVNQYTEKNPAAAALLDQSIATQEAVMPPVSVSLAESSLGSALEVYTFRSEKLLHSHFEKHGKEFGDVTLEEYLARANALITSPTALQKIENEDGDRAFYEESNNTFLILSKDGYIRTFFKPSDGIDYYHRQ